jgi:phosphatidylglycerol:prolipoprotein diacylglycerol transferase
MHPVMFRIGSFAVHWYGVAMALGFAAGLANWLALGRGRGRDYNFCMDLLFWIMASGLAGARLAFVLSDPRPFLAKPLSVFYIHQGGLIYYGGFAAAVAAVLAFAGSRRQKRLALLDFTVTSVPLAHAFGRVGCFVNGCCFGATYSGALSVSYPRDTAPWWFHLCRGMIGREDRHSLPVHPVQLYEAAFNLALYAALLAFYSRRPRDGRVSALYLLLYPAGRYLLEFLRGDERMRWAGLTAAQGVCVALFACGAALWLLAGRPGGETDGRR